MQSNDELQIRNDRHFFVVVGVAAGTALGLGLAALAGVLPSLKDWQPLMASLVALFAAFMALYNVHLQIQAGIAKDKAARIADREVREEEAKRRDRVFRDCAAIVGQLSTDAFKHCRFVLNTRVNVLAAGHDWLTPIEPPNLSQYKGWRKAWDEIYRPLAHDTTGGLTKAGGSIASTVLKLVDRVVEITDEHEKIVSVKFVPAVLDYSQSDEALAIVEHFQPMAEELKRGEIY